MELGLTGVADVVELHRVDEKEKGPGLAYEQYARVVPIEYKRGKPKKDHSDRVQLGAQAMCLEEMFHCEVPVGYLFYGKRKRRTEVVIDEPLRERTRAAAGRLHEMIANRETPRAQREPKCDSCSLVELCLPSGTGPHAKSAIRFQRQLTATLAHERGPAADEGFDAFE